MATKPNTPVKIDVRKLASDAGVAVEAYDTYDTDEETMNAAQRFAAAIVERLAVISDSTPNKALDTATLRSIAAGLKP
jgi:hypothetical protein